MKAMEDDAIENEGNATEPVAEPSAAVQSPAPIEPVASQPAAPVAAPKADTVPLPAYLDERDKRQNAQREAAELRAWREAQERRREAEVQAPNILDDPDGYHQWVQQEFGALNQRFEQTLDARLAQQRIGLSMRAWKKELGAEQFKSLHEWTATMPPGWVAWAEAQDDPFGAAFDEFDKHRKAERAKEFEAKLSGKDLDAYIAEQVEARLAAAQAQPTVAATQPRAADGTFASPATQRRTAPSLSQINGASASMAEPASGYDALFRK